MFFSIIITCYNEGQDVLSAVRSAQAQTFHDYEIIVVKDYSNHQPTLEVCRLLQNEGIQVLYAERNVGVSVTRNMGIAVAKGDIIYTLDGDDVLPPVALAIIADTFDKYPEADVVFGNYALIEGDIQKIVDCSLLVDETNILRIDKYLSCGVLPYGQNATRKRVAIEYPSSERYSFGCQDFELQLRMLEHGVKFIYTPHVLYQWYRKPTGINSSQRNAKSLDVCMYEHIETVAPYIGHRYLLGLCKENHDTIRYRHYFAQYAPFYLRWAKYLPMSILTKLSCFIK